MSTQSSFDEVRSVAILGAGYMSSSMTFPLASMGIETRLWATWLDDEIVHQCRSGEHPRLKKKLPGTTQLFDSSQLAQAVKGADCVFVGVSSEGFAPVLSELLRVDANPVPIFALTKGFVQDDDGVVRTSELTARRYASRFPGHELHWTSIGGPVKAYELARGIPSPAIYGTTSDVCGGLAALFQNEYYRVRTTTDVTGVELSAAFKNVYAIVIGICDGLFEKRYPMNYHNLSSFLFTQAVHEMALIVEAAGGSAQTVHDLAGVGDLYVTSLSGKNQYFGRLVGQGLAPRDAFEQMENESLLAEGYIAVDLGQRWLSQSHPERLEDLPLFRTLYQICYGGAPVEESLRTLVADDR